MTQDGDSVTFPKLVIWKVSKLKTINVELPYGVTGYVATIEVEKLGIEMPDKVSHHPHHLNQPDYINHPNSFICELIIICLFVHSMSKIHSLLLVDKCRFQYIHRP
jgi:hypothetical protein